MARSTTRDTTIRDMHCNCLEEGRESDEIRCHASALGHRMRCLGRVHVISLEEWFGIALLEI